jgi:hypothetical protein
MVKIFLEGFMEYSGTNLSAELSESSARGIEIGFVNFLMNPKDAVSSFVENICGQNFLNLWLHLSHPFHVIPVMPIIIHHKYMELLKLFNPVF